GTLEPFFYSLSFSPAPSPSPYPSLSLSNYDICKHTFSQLTSVCVCVGVCVFVLVFSVFSCMPAFSFHIIMFIYMWVGCVARFPRNVSVFVCVCVCVCV